METLITLKVSDRVVILEKYIFKIDQPRERASWHLGDGSRGGKV